MKTVLLCGGRGMRLAELTGEVPKPLVSVAGRPILEWIIAHYVAHGWSDVVLALGYRADRFHQWVTGEVPAPLPAVAALPATDARPYAITLVDTGEATDTGGRVHQMAPIVGREPFFLTYGDGLSTVNIGAALNFHRRHGRLVTVTAIHPYTTLGVLDIAPDGAVNGFREKPRLDVWINGGFFICEPGVFEWTRPSCNFEKDVLPRLAAAGELCAFRHDGFWACMDTAKDQFELDALLRSGASPILPPSWFARLS